MNLLESLIAGIPAAFVTALIGTIVSIAIGRMDKRQKDRDKARKNFELFQIQMISACASLGKANAIALQNGKCNGETHAALEALEEIKRKQRDFLIEHGLDDIF